MAEARDNPTNCTPTRKSDPIKEMNEWLYDTNSGGDKAGCDEKVGGVKSSESSNKSNIYVKEVKPLGAINTVHVYTDGYAQVNKGKIEVYIRGKIKEPENLDELKKRLRELTKIKNNNPKEFTKELKKEFKQIDSTIQKKILKLVVI